jgi:hypothetical protein
MSVLPINKYFRVILGATFDYPFQYLSGVPGNATPVDLTGYTGAWTLHTPDGIVTYTTGASPGESGVFFSMAESPHYPMPTLYPAPTDYPGPLIYASTGVIDLVISASDTAAITWKTIKYNLSITSPLSVVTNLLTGSINVTNTLP